MLVLMEPGADAGATQRVGEQVRAVGLTADVLTGAAHTIVAITGAADATLKVALAALPGVAEVVTDSQDTVPLTRNLRVVENRPLVSPAILLEELPLTAAAARTVSQSRDETVAILDGSDDRLIVVVGPCSIHDPVAALDYAQRLATLAGELSADLRIIMRVYFEKPRTTVGWKGLINDPNHDESFAVNTGLRLARRILLDILALGLPAGCEFLDPISPQYFADAVTWSAIGARTTESQVHREVASGLSMPVGFKNGTGGGIQMAVDAVRAAAYPHQFLGVTEEGLAAIVVTRGNQDGHVILRGGTTGTNYDAASVASVLTTLHANGLPRRLMIDTSHGNSNKDYRRQPIVAHEIAEQVAAGQTGIIGVLMESFLVDGRQDLKPGVPATYGQSITDGCMGWDTSVPVLHSLAAAVRARRAGEPAIWREAITPSLSR
ncbi:MAG TPA: 3-deoxy-7-phosphoheptulonate synthase [Thermomicrobiales bacterium]